METDRKKSFLISTLYFITVIATIYLLFRYLLIYLLPFLIGLLLAYIVRRPASILAKKLNGNKNLISAFLVSLIFITVISVVGVVIFLIVSRLPQIVEMLIGVISDMGGRLSGVSETYEGWISGMPDGVAEVLRNVPSKTAEAIVNYITGAASSLAGHIASAIPSAFFSIAVTLIASFYIAKDYSAVRYFILSMIPENRKKLFFAVKRLLFVNVFRLFKGYFILMLITFSELVVGFLIIGVHQAWLLAAVIALIDVLPVLGTGTVLIPWSVYLLATGDVLNAVMMLILYILVMLIRNFAEPKIVGQQVGIPPIVSLLILFIGLKIFGFIGMAVSMISLIIVVALYKEGTITL